MPAESDADVALVQEATPPPSDLGLEVDDAPWETSGAGLSRAWRAAVARMSDLATVRFRPCLAMAEAEMGQLVSCRQGTMAITDAEVPGEEPVTVVSMYAAWERPARFGTDRSSRSVSGVPKIESAPTYKAAAAATSARVLRAEA